MKKYKNVVIVCLLMAVSLGVEAQNNTNSPYTRYGYGLLGDQSLAANKGMAGLGYAIREKGHINPLNPASYTAVDSLTFLIEGGVSLQNIYMVQNGVKLNAKNSSLDYVTMQFRLRKGLGMSLGLLPYSNAGYSFSDTRTMENGEAYSRSYTGNGGLHQVYAGLGFEVVKGLSIGANVSYLWGEIDRTRTLVYPGSSSNTNYNQVSNISIRDYKFDVGAQYVLSMGGKHQLLTGVTYTPQRKLKNTHTLTTEGSTSNTESESLTLGLPATYGAGIAYQYGNRWTVGADYRLEQWNKVPFASTDPNTDFAATFDLADSQRFALGATYQPNEYARSMFKRMKYRMGAHYALPYYKIGGKRATREYGASVGISLPLPRSRSLVSLSGQYVRIQGQEAGFSNENMFRLSIGVTFNEIWFFKRKVD